VRSTPLGEARSPKRKKGRRRKRKDDYDAILFNSLLRRLKEKRGERGEDGAANHRLLSSLISPRGKAL